MKRKTKNNGEKKKIVLKIVTAEWKNASRDKRELSVVKELGADVLVMAKGKTTGKREIVDGFRVLRMSSRPCGEWMPNTINRFFSVFTWAIQARKIHPNVLSCHDLIALYIGWISTWFISKKNRPCLVYDSHEFTIYDGKRSKFEEKLVTVLERFLIKKCSFVIEVNDLIADEVQQIHKLEQRPIVIRNIPEKWTVDYKECADVRKKLTDTFNSEEDCFIIMYHGIVVPDRGIEVLLQVLKINSMLRLFILGDGDLEYVNRLKNYCVKEKIDNRVIFHESVPQSELWKYVGAVDVGMIMIQATSKNHYYMLPNKFFECVQSETPVICSSFPALKPLVEKYGIGLTCNSGNIKEINSCIEKLRLDKEFLSELHENTKTAKNELCWEKEKEVLKKAYRRLL